MNMKVMNLGVAIKPQEEEKEKTMTSGIIIPKTASSMQKYKKGVVVAVGQGTEDRPMELRVGETVFYKKANYPKSGDCDVVSVDDVLYVE